MIKKIILPVVTLLLVSTAVASTLNVGIAEELTLREMLSRHVDRLMRKDGILLPTREPVTNWFGRVIMRGDDILSPGYHYIQMRDNDAYAEVRDEHGVYEGEVAPLSEDAVFMLGDFFGFIPGEDTPEYMRLSHLVSKWQVFESAADSENADYNEEELGILISRAARKIRRLADAPLVVTNLQVTAVNAGTEDFTFVVEWPSTMTFPMNRIDIYSSVDLKGAWSYYDSIDSTGVNAATVIVQKASIPGWRAAVPLQHDDDCFATTNIVASAFDPLASYTNITWSCDHKSTAETPGFFRLADRTDSDNDGITDAAEKWVYSFDTTDTDGDGMPDWWEISHGFDPNTFGEELDSDQDGLPDSKELELGTNPNNPDSDGDGVDDGDEFYAETNPLNQDTDGDGILDGEEFEYGTNPLVAEDLNTYSPVVPLALAMPNEEEDIFNGPQEYYDEDDGSPAFELLGTHSIAITYTNETTTGFSVMGVAPPGGTTTRPANATQGVWYNIVGPGQKNEFDLEATGVTFRPLKTGYFSFQVHSDDTATLKVGGEDGATASSDYYGDNPSQIAKKLFVAGESYDVSISAHNNGGPAELSIPVFGDFEPALKPQLAMKLSADAVIFENEYQNIPCLPNMPRHSSQTIVRLGVRGGALGGRLEVSARNAKCLDLARGQDLFNMSCIVGENDCEEWCSVYEGIEESSVTNDIVIVARFLENITGEEYAITNTMTSIRYEFSTENIALANQDRKRHIIGVGEYVAYNHYPQCADISWRFYPNGTANSSIVDYGDKFLAPLWVGDTIAGSAYMIVQISGYGIMQQSIFMICTPHIVARNPRVNSRHMDNPPKMGSSGHLLLYLNYYAAPFIVNFAGLYACETVEESPSGEVDGYFLDTEKGGSLVHGVNQGAGIWNLISANSFVAEDKAGRDGWFPGPWIDGYKTWNISIDWGLPYNSCGTMFPDPQTKQKVYMNSSGAFKVKKFGYEAYRNRWGWKTINGKPVW